MVQVNKEAWDHRGAFCVQRNECLTCSATGEKKERQKENMCDQELSHFHVAMKDGQKTGPSFVTGALFCDLTFLQLRFVFAPFDSNFGKFEPSSLSKK